ncbi:hypothetical protein A6A04_02045 [Paramagnetospirillum marisnigri]|uniref:Co-chaperone DjlA N-terminal domain-containing protein n=1 Tax=Paramagnetospirillum marisnigri TaxID=1285242 RepID=A0A178MN61_9PROT|nr:TerB family tellurite resistance protein [Paramagnetospirillum marisnigri]OAN50210.1 hypothetical protein A6A04_02045 [Paramagnetospirillum marisnigri]
MTATKKLLDAAMAAAAIIAKADGWVSEEESNVVARLARGIDDVSSSHGSQAMALYAGYVRKLGQDNGAAAREAWNALAAVADDPETAKAVLAIACRIADVDSKIYAEEALLLRMIANELRQELPAAYIR